VHIIGAMSRPLRLPPLVRAPLTLVSLVLLLAGGITLAVFPFLVADATAYRQAIGDPARECAHNPIPASGGCWSAAAAKVVITGVDHLDSGDVQYLVVAVPGHIAVRENLVPGAHATGIGVGTTVTVRYWHSDIAQILPPVDHGAAVVALATRDSPTYRTAQFPIGSAIVAGLGVAGLIGFGVPLFFDVQRWRRRRRIDAEAEAAAREATTMPGFGRGLLRYGMSLGPTAEPTCETTTRTH
jgi:hypothetical protein